MLNKTISLLLIFCLALHCSAKVGVIAYFYANQSYIAEFLCVNKSKPQLHCDGKCFLAQKLKAQDEQTKELPSSIKVAQETTYCFEKTIISVSAFSSFFTKAVFSIIHKTNYQSPDIGIELPPKT